MKFGADFFAKDTLEVAKKLLGKKLVRIYRGKRIEGIITETEAYVGPEDKASHASRGKTLRTEVMFGNPGVIYVYMIYGMYHCLNIVTGEKNYPAAVLIRGVSSGEKNLNGPGKVCRFFHIDRTLNKKTLSKNSGLWIKNGIIVSSKKISASPRIGVNYAGPIWSVKPWRFTFSSA